MLLNWFRKSDEELMLLIAAGQEKAFATLYSRYSGPMVRYFYRMLGNDHDNAQDFLHDLFVKIIEKPGTFNREKKFSTWIYSVAHNMCKNEYRRKAYHYAFTRRVVTEEAVDAGLGKNLDRELFTETVRREIMTWDEADRTLFVLRHELEMSFPEIGDILGCPEGTAKSRWFYLRKSLAEKFIEFQSILK